MSSIFGFYYVIGLLNYMGWPQKRGLFNSEDIVNSMILDLAIEQMIDWAASIGACRPKLALQIIATIFSEVDWESKDALNFNIEINNMKKQWAQKDANNNNPKKIINPVKFSKLNDSISMDQLKNKEIKHALEVYFYESLIWGLVNPINFKTYYAANEESKKEKMTEYKEAGLEVDCIPTLDQSLKDGEEIIKSYGNEIRPLSPIPEKLIKDMFSLGIEIKE